MTFPLIDINVTLSCEFANELAQVLEARPSQLVLVHAGATDFKMYIVKDYLRIIAEETLRKNHGPVTVVHHQMAQVDLENELRACGPGHVVFFGELNPRDNAASALGLADRFARTGATVIAAIHGPRAEDAQFRLQQLMEAAVRDGLPYPVESGELGPYRLIAYAGTSREVLVRASPPRS